MRIKEFQELIKRTYFEKDKKRGLDKTFLWFIEEVGELAEVLLKDKGNREKLNEEFSDVLAWLFSLANLAGIDMEEAIRRYERGCPKCHHIPCICKES